MLEGLFKTQVKSVVETNLGGLVGKISINPTLNFNPKVTLYVASRPKAPTSSKNKSQATADKSAAPSIRSNKKTIRVDNRELNLVEPTPEKVFVFELKSGRDIVLALSQENGSKKVGQKPNEKAIEELRDGLPNKYSLKCHYEENFPVDFKNVNQNLNSGSPDIKRIGVLLLTISSEEFGSEKFHPAA